MKDCDLLIAGGGLAGGLIALAVARLRPEVRVAIIEAGETVGGNHIWSFFDSDVATEDRWLIEPLVAQHWDGHDVAFSARRRALTTGYNSLTSERLDAAVREALPAERILTGRRVTAMTPHGVELEDGERIAAGAVIDARGAGDLSALELGWQKFVGRALVLARPHGVSRPVVMDATVAQIDGYRFVYLLPFGADRIFVEDTYYSDSPELDREALRERITAYAAAKRWRVKAVQREEAGVLPVVLDGDFDAYWGDDGVAKAGVRAGLFHPMTSYSLPDAVAFALWLAKLDRFEGKKLHDRTKDYAARRWWKRGFYRLLARMMFRAAEPRGRYRLLEHFYGKDEGVISRFYAGKSTKWDKVRILSGRPPASPLKALKILAGIGK